MAWRNRPALSRPHTPSMGQTQANTLAQKSLSVSPVWTLKHRIQKQISREVDWDAFFPLLVHRVFLVLAASLLHWPLQVPEELQLPGSEPHLVSLGSNQWNRTSGATDICRCSVHGAPGCPVQTAGHQAQALPAAVSRAHCGLSLLFPCSCVLSLASSLPDQHSARKLPPWSTVLAPSELSCSPLGSRALIWAAGRTQWRLVEGVRAADPTGHLSSRRCVRTLSCLSSEQEALVTG